MSDLEALGRQWHPNVTDYRSGGIGHREGDESRTVVGFLPTEALKPYAEHDGYWNSNPPAERDVRRVREIADDIKSGVGIKEPLHLEHDPAHGWAVLGEGNHRLRAAQEAGAPVVPVRVYGRARLDRKVENGVGAPLRRSTSFGDDGDGYQYDPPAVHPDHYTFHLGQQ